MDIELGCRVKVIDRCLNYSSYYSFFDCHRIPWYKESYNGVAKNGCEGTVVFRGVHIVHHGLILNVVRFDDGMCTIIEDRGLKVIDHCPQDLKTGQVEMPVEFLFE